MGDTLKNDSAIENVSFLIIKNKKHKGVQNDNNNQYSILQQKTLNFNVNKTLENENSTLYHSNNY